jgi:uncharacterized protein
MAEWQFYGRSTELDALTAILHRNRWFFVKVSGRRRIGKTTLVQQAIINKQAHRVVYVQIPDSGDAGVLSAFVDALETFGIRPEEFPYPRSLNDMAATIESLIVAGTIVILDEFQYFVRAPLAEFASYLQTAVDRMAAQSSRAMGGLIVLGSIHTEMAALLEDRAAPLYNRVTDVIDLVHWDVGSVMSVLRDHTDASPQRLLTLWTLFEGVPKFYRDCWEQGVIDKTPNDLLQKIFFGSSSPLRSEAENWFLRELRGRYDTVLKFVARHPGSSHGDLVEAMRQTSGGTTNQIGGYLQTLCDRYHLIESKLPIFAKTTARRRRYYLSDNFLESWLAAIAPSVAAREFRPQPQLITEAVERLQVVEGKSLEKLASKLYEERSRKNVGDFPLTHRILGYWDRNDVEIDLVAMNETDRRLRFGTCKRSPGKLIADINNFKGHVARFLQTFREFQDWQIEHVAIAPQLDDDHRRTLNHYGIIPQDLVDLTEGLP